MRGRIGFTDGRVETTPDDFPLTDDNGSDRNFPQAFGGTSQRQRFAHEKFIVHPRILQYPRAPSARRQAAQAFPRQKRSPARVPYLPLRADRLRHVIERQHVRLLHFLQGDVALDMRHAGQAQHALHHQF